MPLLLILDTLIVHDKNLNKFAARPPFSLFAYCTYAVWHHTDTQIHREREKKRESGRVSETTFNYVKQAGSNTRHHQKRISVIRAEAGRARVLGPGNGNRGWSRWGQAAGNHLLCHFMAVAALFVAAAAGRTSCLPPAACCLLPLCLLFVSFFAWKITRTKNIGGGEGRRHRTRVMQQLCQAIFSLNRLRI